MGKDTWQLLRYCSVCFRIFNSSYTIWSLSPDNSIRILDPPSKSPIWFTFSTSIYYYYYTSGLKSEKKIHQLIRIKCAYIYTIFSAIKSIDRYRQIEKKSGIDFYNEVGFLTIRGPDEGKKLIIKRGIIILDFSENSKVNFEHF